MPDRAKRPGLPWMSFIAVLIWLFLIAQFLSGVAVPRWFVGGLLVLGLLATIREAIDQLLTRAGWDVAHRNGAAE